MNFSTYFHTNSNKKYVSNINQDYQIRDNFEHYIWTVHDF
jgi:hypothetical protein